MTLSAYRYYLTLLKMSANTDEDWTDKVYALVEQGEGLLSALLSVKKQLDLESNPTTDILYKGGLSEVTYTFKRALLQYESPSRPPLNRISILQNPDMNVKLIYKKYPDPAQFGKVTLKTANESGFLYLSTVRKH